MGNPTVRSHPAHFEVILLCRRNVRESLSPRSFRTRYPALSVAIAPRPFLGCDTEVREDDKLSSSANADTSQSSPLSKLYCCYCARRGSSGPSLRLPSRAQESRLRLRSDSFSRSRDWSQLRDFQPDRAMPRCQDLAQLVAAKTGPNQTEAERRVTGTILEARQTVDRVRNVTPALLWTFLALLMQVICGVSSITSSPRNTHQCGFAIPFSALSQSLAQDPDRRNEAARGVRSRV
jgi:hypothetical protein